MLPSPGQRSLAPVVVQPTADSRWACVGRSGFAGIFRVEDSAPPAGWAVVDSVDSHSYYIVILDWSVDHRPGNNPAQKNVTQAMGPREEGLRLLTRPTGVSSNTP